jgi:hypothetical protein
MYVEDESGALCLFDDMDEEPAAGAGGAGAAAAVAAAAEAAMQHRQRMAYIDTAPDEIDTPYVDLLVVLLYYPFKVGWVVLLCCYCTRFGWARLQHAAVECVRCMQLEAVATTFMVDATTAV